MSEFLSGWPTPLRLDQKTEKPTNSLQLTRDELDLIEAYASKFYDKFEKAFDWLGLCERIAYNVKFARKFSAQKTSVAEYLSTLKTP